MADASSPGDPTGPPPDRLTALALRRSALTKDEAELLDHIFTTLMKRHHALVWDQLRHRGLRENEAEDLLQDTFMALYGYLLEHGFPDSVPALLRTLARHRLLNYIRDQKREPMSLGLPSSCSEKPRSTKEIERVLDMRALFHQLLQGLTFEHQAVVNLVILGDLSHADAALALDIPEGTLKSRLAAAKRALYAAAEKLFPPSQRGAS